MASTSQDIEPLIAQSFILIRYNAFKVHRILILIEDRMSQERDIQQKYSDLLSKYKKVLWTSVTSVAALAGTVIYSKYQIFRKEKVIDEKDNQIKNQKEELHHLRHEAKELNKQLVEEFKVILKNLKQNILNDPNVKGYSTSLKNEINSTFEAMNGSLHNKLEQLKSYNYKEAMEKWYLANMISNEGFKFNTLRKIEVVEANWKHYKDSINEGYTWRKDGNHSFAGMAETSGEAKAEFEKMRAYFEKKNTYESRGLEVNANTENLGNSFIGSKKALLLKYRCWGFDIQTGLFSVPLQPIKPVKGEEPDVKIERVDEGRESYIDCRDNEWTRKQ